ncbi:ABC transporter ATP-binding protein [Blastococcus sp. TML/M2B]|uniref:ABC transporter ATP-binding protein n=1 Tax=unclassified Blastococcus TaxID=2619396 RepID=UPI00190DE0A5|nr:MULTISPECIES: ABC transporter ATP-binding protein [unclassified Blastococcus]MBN1091651.1 ABC transporter ATP-binding protein [Blastococcus sp. TML/M2B]MBN1094791.1 ABC transporter ATP-binding protein [Blastococcus sp. TML/C7B]
MTTTGTSPHGLRADGPAVRVRGLVKRYGDRAVVDGLDLDVHPGEVFALLGPNGAGKTTTVEILEGLRRRDGGEVRVLGVDPAAGDRTWRARIGVVGQATGDGNALTVRETLDHFAVYHSRSAGADELIAAVGLTEAAGTRAARLSGGQRRRLEVALSMQGRPELLFLDEPTTGLDPVARRQFWAVLQRLREGGTTILLTTHYLDEAAHLADRVGVIDAGRLADVAPPEQMGGELRRRATVRWREGSGVRSVVTTEPDVVLRDLLTTGPRVALPDLTVTRPTLEEVYLQLVGAAPAEPAPEGVLR